jgi:hypothetical protein
VIHVELTWLINLNRLDGSCMNAQSSWPVANSSVAGDLHNPSQIPHIAFHSLT